MKANKTITLILALVLLCSCIISCGNTQTTPDITKQQITTSPETGASTADTEETSSIGGVTSSIKLNGTSAECGEGAVYENGIVSITSAGTYTISGKLTDGQIRVNVTKEERVELILDGVDITSSSSAAIYIVSADKTTINVMAGTTNVLTDSSNYVYEAGMDEPNSCVYSSDDMTIKGSGTLTVNGRWKNGISSKNDIKIKEVSLTINASNTGIRGKDSVEIESGNITIVAGNDGIKSSNDTEAGRGYIQITGGSISIDAGDDALQAVTEIIASDCKIIALSQGKTYNCPGTVNIADGCLTIK